MLKGVLMASGMYDLKPVRLSKRSKYVKFTDAIEEEMSSQRHLDRLNCPVILACGTYETPEFQRQARDMHAALKAAGKCHGSGAKIAIRQHRSQFAARRENVETGLALRCVI